jgi:tetratricopeptide (TPR) repeat protein
MAMGAHTNRIILILILTGSTVIYAGCGRGGLNGYYSLGSPEYHFITGMKLMERYNLDNVEREFLRAREVRPDFAPAYVGLAMVSSARGDFDRAMENLKQAKLKSKTDNDKATVAMGTIKVYTDLYMVDREKGSASGWLDIAEEAYREGLKLNSNQSALHFFMGRAYKAAGKRDEAEKSFHKVVDLGADYVAQAREELKTLSRADAGKSK